MTKQTQQNLKNHIIHHAMQWIEENGGDKNDISDVLCELSKEIRSGDGPIFTHDKVEENNDPFIMYDIGFCDNDESPIEIFETAIHELERNRNIAIYGETLLPVLKNARDRLKALEIFLENKR